MAVDGEGPQEIAEAVLEAIQSQQPVVAEG